MDHIRYRCLKTEHEVAWKSVENYSKELSLKKKMNALKD